MATQDYPGKGLSLSQLTFALNEEVKRTVYSSSFTLDDVSRLDQGISTALANIREWRNSFVPINRVPLDVLSLVPNHLYSQKDRFRATFVCRHWRRTFLQHGSLWSQIVLKKGETYMRTLLERAKGSALDITASGEDPVGSTSLVPPHTQQIRSIYFAYGEWKDIQRFLEINSGPLPLLHNLTIYVRGEYTLGQPTGTAPPSSPLFTDAVNVKDFALHAGGFPYLSHFVFPNLTEFKLSATPVAESGYRVVELLDFLEASPMLRTVSIKIMTEMLRLDGIPRERVVVLPDVKDFSLVVDDPGAGYELVTHVSCPSVMHTSLVYETFNDNDIPIIIFPPTHYWIPIVGQYIRSPTEEIAFEMKHSDWTDPIVSCSLSFRSPDTTAIELGFKLLRSADDDENEDPIPFDDLRSVTFSDASKTIRDHPFLSNIKRLLIRYSHPMNDIDQLRYLSKVFGRLFKSLGPLDVLSIYGCDPSYYLTPFLNFPEYAIPEHLATYPPIKELKILHPLIPHRKEECATAIVKFAKSQYKRGVPFDRVEICMEQLPTGVAEGLGPWVKTVDCYEEPRKRACPWGVYD